MKFFARILFVLIAIQGLSGQEQVIESQEQVVQQQSPMNFLPPMIQGPFGQIVSPFMEIIKPIGAMFLPKRRQMIEKGSDEVNYEEEKPIEGFIVE